MSTVTIKVKMFTLPNFMKLEPVATDSCGIDVGALFPTDAAAAEFWDDCQLKWLAHVEQRRKALGKTSGEDAGR